MLKSLFVWKRLIIRILSTCFTACVKEHCKQYAIAFMVQKYNFFYVGNIIY